jgi:hypothetical protein
MRTGLCGDEVRALVRRVEWVTPRGREARRAAREAPLSYGDHLNGTRIRGFSGAVDQVVRNLALGRASLAVRFNYRRRLSTIQYEDVAARLLACAALNASIAIDRYLHEPALLSSLLFPEADTNGQK